MRSRNLFLPLSVLLAVHLLFFTRSLTHPPAPLSDSREYLLAAENIYTRGTLYCGDLSEPHREELYTRRPPVYPLFAGAALLFGSSVPLHLLQIALSLLSIFLVFSIYWKPSDRNHFQVLFLVLLAATPAQFIYACRTMAEILFQFLVVGMAWAFHRWSILTDNNKQNKGLQTFTWIFFLLLTLGMATKPVLFPLALLLVPLSIVLFLKTRQRTLLLALTLPLAWFVFYGIRNHRVTGSWQYSSIQTANLVNYNLRYFLTGREGSENAAERVNRVYEQCGNAENYREKNKCLDREAHREIMDQPIRYGAYHLKGCLRYFFDPGRFDLVTFFDLSPPESEGFLKSLNQEGLKGAFRVLKNQGWGLIAVLAIIVLFKLFKISGFLIYLVRAKEALPLRLFLALLITYMALVTGPLGASRFLLPVELLIIGGACRGWQGILPGLRGSEKDIRGPGSGIRGPGSGTVRKGPAKE